MSRNECRLHTLAVALLTLFLGCSPQRFFYYPNQVLYNDPDAAKIPYDIHTYPSLNGKKLSGILMRGASPSKGIVVHFHGNFGNLSNHFPLSVFLLKHGFDVFIFDYQGYGASQGRPTPKNTVEDGIATLRYAQAQLRGPQKGVVILGQSLGGATAIVAMSREPLAKAAVIEAAFSTYPKMGATVLRRHVWTWPFSWIVPVFLNRAYSPIRFVGEISPRPLLFIHGDADTIVPLSMSKELFDQAREPKKLWIVEGAGHLEARRRAGAPYETEVVNFFTAALSTATNTAAK